MLEFKLKDAKFDDNAPISEWDYIQYNDFFVFYKPQEKYFKSEENEKLGFKFMSLQITGRYPENPLLHPENNIEILYWGEAMFDGIRHLFLGHEKTDNYGYINYPFIKNHIKLLQIIRELELKYCRDSE